MGIEGNYTTREGHDGMNQKEAKHQNGALSALLQFVEMLVKVSNLVNTLTPLG